MDKEKTSLAEMPSTEMVEQGDDLSRIDAEDLARSVASVREQMDATLDELGQRLRPIVIAGGILAAVGLGLVVILRVRRAFVKRHRDC